MVDGLGPQTFLNSVYQHEVRKDGSWRDPVGASHSGYYAIFNQIVSPVEDILKAVEAFETNLNDAYDNGKASQYISGLERELKRLVSAD